MVNHLSTIKVRYTPAQPVATMMDADKQRFLVANTNSAKASVFPTMLDRGSILQSVISVSNYHLRGLLTEAAKLTFLLYRVSQSVAFVCFPHQLPLPLPASLQALSNKCKTENRQEALLLSAYKVTNFRKCKSDVWLTVHRNSVWIRKTNQMSLFVFFISLLIVAQHVSANHVPIIRS